MRNANSIFNASAIALEANMLPIANVKSLEHFLDLIPMQLTRRFTLVNQEPEFNARIGNS